MYDQMVKALWKLSKAYPKGFTVSLPDLKPVDKGWCIGRRETQYCFGRKGLKKALTFALENGCEAIGGWRGYDGRYYFDAVMIRYDAYEALNLKEEHGQQAVYNIETGRII